MEILDKVHTNCCNFVRLGLPNPECIRRGICGIAIAKLVSELVEDVKLASNANHLTWTLIPQENKISSKIYDSSLSG
jgi:hypothetical protein